VHVLVTKNFGNDIFKTPKHTIEVVAPKEEEVNSNLSPTI
jgi:hypothetical protein